MSRIRVVLADDHELVRAGIRALLENLPGVEVVGEAGNGLEALEVIAKTSPDIVLLDLGMPVLNGFNATERIVKEIPVVRIVILSMHRAEEYVTYALRAGASGYIIKDAASGESRRPCAPWRVEGLSQPRRAKPGPASSSGPKIPELTPRQREVLQLIAEGRSTKEAAHILQVSIKTIEAHRSQLMERLNIHDLPALVRYAMRTGLIHPEPFQER